MANKVTAMHLIQIAPKKVVVFWVLQMYIQLHIAMEIAILMEMGIIGLALGITTISKALIRKIVMQKRHVSEVIYTTAEERFRSYSAKWITGSQRPPMDCIDLSGGYADKKRDNIATRKGL